MRTNLKLLHSVFVGLLISIFLCTSCSSQGNLQDGLTKSSTTKETVPGKNVSPVTLKFTYWGSPYEKDSIEGVCKAFTAKYPQIIMDPRQIPESDYDIKIAAMIASEDPPDYAYIHGQQGEDFARKGKFINWFEMLKGDKELRKEDFVDGIWFTLTPDNAWAVSASIECFGLFYNKDILKTAGIPYPPAKYEAAWTWEQFVSSAKKLTLDKQGRNAADPNFDPQSIVQYGVSFENWFGPVLVHVLNNGGDIVLEDGKTFGYSRPEAVRAIQRLADLIQRDHVAPSPIQAKAIPSQAAALKSGLIAMSMHGQWINLDLGASKVNYGIAALPKMDKGSGTMVLSGANAVFKDTRYLNEAWIFAKYLCGEGAESLYASGLWMPPLKKYYSDKTLLDKWLGPNPAHPEGFKEAMLDMVLNHSKPGMNYYLKNQTKIDAMVEAALDPVWMGKKTVEQAMKELEPSVKPEIQGRYDKN